MKTPRICRAPTSTGARSRPQPLVSRSLSLGLRSVGNRRSVHVLKCLLLCLSALDCLACLECCRFESKSNVGVDAAVGLKAMHQMSRLQKAKDKIPGLAATDLTWLDDALKPSDSSAPSASAAKPPSTAVKTEPEEDAPDPVGPRPKEEGPQEEGNSQETPHL